MSAGELTELARETQVTRLGEGVDTSGRLSEEAIERVCAALARYREEIDRLGAEDVVAVATSAVRDAANGEEFRSLLRERFGIDARTISGDEEARLSFRGATADAGGEETLVIDIGGGSTEFVVGRPPADPDFHVSTTMGSVRHTERHLADDPPVAEQLVALRADARRIVESEVPADVRAGVEQAIAVAGTATSLAAIDQDLEPPDPERVHGYALSRDACLSRLERLAALPVVERRGVRGLHPDRAPTIVAGVAILVESLQAFGLETVRVSEADILHGAALAAGGGNGG